MYLLSKPLLAERHRIAQSLPSFDVSRAKVHNLSYEDVLDAHFCIADFFERDEYGMAGVGPRDLNLLVSTVERQFAGFSGYEACETPFQQIATLMYGIIKNHPCYDANKRSAFLCALVQLHRLGRVVTAPEHEFENLMVEIADRSIDRKRALKDVAKKGHQNPEIVYLGRYLEKNSRKTARLNKSLKFKDLRMIVSKNGFEFRSLFKGTIDIVKVEEQRVARFWRSDKIVKSETVVGCIPYHGEGVDVPDAIVKRVRQICGISDQDGFDGEVILRDAQPTFQLIRSYRGALQRLAYR
jgi:death-on-curing family protein